MAEISLHGSFEYFKKAFGRRKIALGETADVTGLFSQTKNQIIRNGVVSGLRVYALPVQNGKGMFEKFEEKDGAVVRNAQGKPVVGRSPLQTAVAFLCSPKLRNIGSDELLAGNEPSMEGVKREEALAVFNKLKMNPEQDAYVLFVRNPREIKAIASEFKFKLNAILAMGSKFAPKYYLKKIPLNEMFFEKIVGQITAQTHPHNRERAVRDFFGPGIFTDAYLGPKLESALKKSTRDPKKIPKRKMKG